MADQPGEHPLDVMKAKEALAKLTPASTPCPKHIASQPHSLTHLPAHAGGARHSPHHHVPGELASTTPNQFAPIESGKVGG